MKNWHFSNANQHLIIENQHLIIENQYFSNAMFLRLDLVVFD
jgi:hypothetical protein